MNNNPLIFSKYCLMGSSSVLWLHLVSLVANPVNIFALLACLLVIMLTLRFIRGKGVIIRKDFRWGKDKMEAEQEPEKRKETGSMHELELMKVEFFSNITHEFRTPLSLILSPIENLIESTVVPEQRQQLLMIQRNGKRLLHLVDQLLDFNKNESGELKLNPTTGDIIKFIEDACSSFLEMARQNRITFLFDSEISVLNTGFDRDKIERIIFNMLSNSFKFTSPGGHVSVFISQSKTDCDLPGNRLLEIKIMDTGIGIPKEKQEKIFDKFFRDSLPGAFLNHGSGIGLSICREFVKLHNGDIEVESEPGNGSCFTIRIPVCIAGDDDGPAGGTARERLHDGPKDNDREPDGGKKPVVLLIDDNDDLRFYLKENLKHSFRIIESANGKDGWRKTLALNPDLIVCDIIMPDMNGLDLCEKIRQGSHTAHIPLIFLTALSTEEDQLAGFAHGANDYITKPFNVEILLSKINGLLFMQQTLKKTNQDQVIIQAEEVERASDDQKFLQDSLNCIEKNLTDHNFSVEQLSRYMQLSRVSLYKKLLRLTGKTPVECIRALRLEKAVKLMKKSNLNIGNISYEVGFNNPNYFSKVFKEEYGILPSEYINEILEPEKKASSGFFNTSR